MAVRHFLTLLDLNREELRELIQRAIAMKAEYRNRQQGEPFKNHVLAMIFEKSSTRTRVSFEAGMAQLGGHAMFLSPNDSQLGRGEPVEDSAKVISSMVDIVMIRTFGHNVVERFAANSSVPVINALTDDYHPCQLLADMQTYTEHRGDISGKTVAWIGDGNNMCQSYINAARQFDFQLNIACPEGFDPNPELLKANSDRVNISRSPAEAVSKESEQQQRLEKFKGYQVNKELLSHAASDVLYMHCLPAHRGEEISAELMDAADSVIWDEAENRLHAQKALMEFLLLAAQ